MKAKNKIQRDKFSNNSRDSLQSLSQDEDLDEEMQDTRSKVGRPRIPLKWTRVFNVKPQALIDIDIFEIQKDHKQFNDQYKDDNPSLNSDWKLIFDPGSYKGQDIELKCSEYEMQSEDLLEYAYILTKVKQQLQARANRVVELEEEVKNGEK